MAPNGREVDLDITQQLRARHAATDGMEPALGAAAIEIDRLRSEAQRFLTILGEGNKFGRPIDMIPKADLERFKRAFTAAK